MRNGKSKVTLIAGILLFLAAFAGCVIYTGLITKPMESADISPNIVPGMWTFSLPDGTELTPQDGKLPVSSENAVVICRYQVTEKLDDAPMITVSAVNCDCVFELDGELIGNSGRWRRWCVR